jgi:ubiquinone/menaquinone biosynthesis C-methylase UbiE
MIYYETSSDVIWNFEISKLIPYCRGKGLDVGCGGRTLNAETETADIDKKHKPTFVCSGDKIPVPDNNYDYLISVHSLEHMENPKACMLEWIRIVKDKGYICIIHPDGARKEDKRETQKESYLKKDPNNRHYHEWTIGKCAEFIDNLKKKGFSIVDFGTAFPQWSYYFILRVTKEGVK